MDVKGTAFIARQNYVSREHGDAAWAKVLAEAARAIPVFGEPIVATTRLPVKDFITLNDLVVLRLYKGDEKSYFRFGEASAVWGLLTGPYRGLVTERSVRGFVATVPTIYRSYFSDGQALAHELDADSAELLLSGIEPHHVYFEYGVAGYFARGLELVSGRAVESVLKRGFPRVDADVRYVMQLGAPKRA